MTTLDLWEIPRVRAPDLRTAAGVVDKLVEGPDHELTAIDLPEAFQKEAAQLLAAARLGGSPYVKLTQTRGTYRPSTKAAVGLMKTVEVELCAIFTSEANLVGVCGRVRKAEDIDLLKTWAREW